MKTLSMIKFGGMLLALIVLIGCQKESLTITDEQEEESFLDDAQLVGLVRGVTAHDGSHDDIVDNSSCFSINYPFNCRVNGEVYLYQQASDLEGLYETDDIEPVFPITITYADYGEIQVSSLAAFQNIITSCATGDLYNEAIACVDLIYPVKIAMYNTTTSNFETRTFNHDRITFTELTAMTNTDLASFQFPLYVQVVGGDIVQINSNQELKATIQSHSTSCE